MTRSLFKFAVAFVLPLLLACASSMTTQAQTLPNIASVARLNAGNYSGSAHIYLSGYRTNGDGGEGNLSLRVGDSSTSADNVCIFVDVVGNRFQRDSCSTQISAKQAGAYGDTTFIGSPANPVTVAMTNGQNIVTCSSCLFSSTATVGMTINVGNASATGDKVLTTTVTQIDSNTQLRTTASATQTIPGSSGFLTYGHDDTTAIRAAITAATSRKSSVFVPGGNYLLTGGLTLDTSKVQMQGTGATLDACGMSNSTSAVILLTNSGYPDGTAGSINLSSNKARAVSGLTLYGCSYLSATAPTGVKYDEAGAPYGSNAALSNVSIIGMYKGVDMSGCSCNGVVHENIFMNGNGYSIYQNGVGPDSGEKNGFSDSFLVNSPYALAYIKLGQMNFDNTSLDGALDGIICDACDVELTGGWHMEQVNNAAVPGHYYFSFPSGAAGNGIIRATGGSLNVFCGQLQHAIDPQSGYMIFNGTTIDQPNQYGSAPCSSSVPGFPTWDTGLGQGYVLFKNVISKGSGVGVNLPVETTTLFTVFGNKIANWNFTVFVPPSDLSGSGWTTTGNVTFDTSSDKKYQGGGGSIHAVCGIAAPAVATYIHPVTPLDASASETAIFSNGLTAAGGSASIQFDYVDAAGNVLRTSAINTITADSAGYGFLYAVTDDQALGPARVPVGAVSKRVKVSCTAGTGNYDVWFAGFNSY